MDITIRLETENDHREVENITREAFWNLYNPGCDEHLIAHNLRKSEDFIPELDFVALDGDKIVGNIMYTKARVTAEDGSEAGVLCLGPVCVLPEYQGRGVGSMLIKHTLDEARKGEHKGVLLFGNPGYYHRFGFRTFGNLFIAAYEENYQW